jgi:hypothetical protein
MTGPIQWERFSLQDMWNMLMAADPRALSQQAELTQRVAGHFRDTADLVHPAARQAMGAWSGDAAQTASEAFDGMLTWSDHTATTTSHVARLLDSYARVVNTARLNMPNPIQVGDLLPGGAIATAQDVTNAHTHAVQVMQHYETNSMDIYHELGKYQYATPTKPFPGDPLPAPIAPEPPAPVITTSPPPNGGTPGGGTGGGGVPSGGGTTTSSSFTPGPGDTPGGFQTGAGGGIGGGAGIDQFGGAGLVGAPGMLGGESVGASGGMVRGLGAKGLAGEAGVLGEPATSGVGAASEAEANMARMAAAEEHAGWNGFGAIPPTGGAPGEGDGEHHDKFAGRSDIIGELPPAFPPVLGQW